jgi:hypothetical protein
VGEGGQVVGGVFGDDGFFELSVFEEKGDVALQTVHAHDVGL